MMVAVAIVAVLAAIAIPNYVRYSLRAKSAEARVLLGGIVTSEEAFMAEYENYAQISTPEPAGTISPGRLTWVNKPCPAACDRENVQNCTAFDCIGFSSPTATYYQYATLTRRASGPTTPEYGVGAAADLDGDGQTGSYAFRSNNETGVQGIVADPVSACPAEIEARVVSSCSPVAY